MNSGASAGLRSGVPDLSADKCEAGVGGFGGRKGVSKMVASVHGLPQLLLSRYIWVFAWSFLLSVLPHASGLCAGQSPGRCRSASRNLAGHCCPDLSVIGRSCWCLCDHGVTWRFVDSDAAAGMVCRSGAGLGYASVRSGQSISLRSGDVKILTDFMSQFIGDFGVAWHR